MKGRERERERENKDLIVTCSTIRHIKLKLYDVLAPEPRIVAPCVPHMNKSHHTYA